MPKILNVCFQIILRQTKPIPYLIILGSSVLHLLGSATNMAPAVPESCQPTFGDVMLLPGWEIKLSFSLQEALFDSGSGLAMADVQP